MKANVIGILLLFCLVAPFTATFTFLHYQKKQVRKEVKRQIIAGIDKEELVLLKFTQNESVTKLHWKHSKEFQYNNQMYDIVERELKGDTIYYWCWWDHRENRLNEQLTDLLAGALNNNSPHQNSSDRLISFMKTLYVDSPITTINTNHLPEEKTRLPYLFNYKIVYLSPPTPPPEIC